MFITFEGLERAGKTTAIKAIEKYLQDNKIEKHFVITREPGGTGIKEAEIIRSFVLSPEYNIDPMSEALLYLVSRKIHLTQKIEPALQEGKIVICDRFIDSSTAYQGFGRELGFEKIQKLNDIVTNNMKPDITFFIKITPQTSWERVFNSENKDIDRLENNGIAFYEKISNGYDEIIKQDAGRFIIIDGTLGLEEVSKEVIKELEKILEKNNFNLKK